ncbi:hypothetical protein DXG01_015562 [Tephrocybe rancida]|nr:hypothetical protein DXG01_015562 [Tephrocybe rancida]
MCPWRSDGSCADWVALKSGFCKAVEEQQAIRKQRERELLIRPRTHSVQEFYGQKVATLLSDIQKTLPEPKDIGLYAHFTQLIYSSTLDGPLPQSDVTANVESFIEHWPPKTFNDFVSLCRSQQKLPSSHGHLDGHHSLNAASFVFLCGKCRIFDGIIIGWQATIPHLRCVQSVVMGPLELSDRGSSAALTLLEQLGLDPKTTLPAELDERRDSVACDPCLTKHGRSPLLSWREAVHHFVVERHRRPKWKMLSSEDVKAMQALQVLDENEEIDTWSSIAGLF